MLDAAGKENIADSFDAEAFKKRLALSIISSEESTMVHSGELIAEMRAMFRE